MTASTVTKNSLQQRVFDALKKRFPEETVDVSTENDGQLHVVVVSRHFDGMTPLESQDYLDGILQKALSRDDWSRITLLIGVSPDRVKALC